MTEREEFEAWMERRVCEIEDFAPYASNDAKDAAWCGWQAARRADEALMRDAAEALEAMQTMSDRGAKPKKLDDALTWVMNDTIARGMVNAAIKKLRARLEGTT